MNKNPFIVYYSYSTLNHYLLALYKPAHNISLFILVLSSRSYYSQCVWCVKLLCVILSARSHISNMFSCFKKPRKPHARKFHSMRSRARPDKIVPQRKVSLQEKLEEKVTIEATPNNTNSTIIQVDEVDHSRSKSSSSRSPSQEPSSHDLPTPVDSNNSGSVHNALTTTEPVEQVTQPQPTSKGMYVHMYITTHMPSYFNWVPMQSLVCFKTL